MSTWHCVNGFNGKETKLYKGTRLNDVRCVDRYWRQMWATLSKRTPLGDDLFPSTYTFTSTWCLFHSHNVKLTSNVAGLPQTIGKKIQPKFSNLDMVFQPIYPNFPVNGGLFPAFPITWHSITCVSLEKVTGQYSGKIPPKQLLDKWGRKQLLPPPPIKKPWIWKMQLFWAFFSKILWFLPHFC